MKVIITEPARKYLRSVFDFYSQYTPKKKNKELLFNVLVKVRSLENMASRGGIETNLLDAPYEYRYLLEGNCKILYRIENDEVLVTDFFDVRQEPSKLITRQS